MPEPAAPVHLLRARIVPLIVAVALFMENMDSTVIATSLPAIAADIGTSPLALKLAITSYLLSLAVFLPVSGWTADRFGARRVFRTAIVVFMTGSIGCALSGSLTQFVLARMVEGMGGAMMTPVGRLILVRSVDKRELINAMVWVTLPALVGPLIGPPLGGFITTYISWHWIFLINIPMGVAGIVLATLFIEDVRAEKPDPLDTVGILLAGVGIGGLAFGGSVLGLNFLPHRRGDRAHRHRRGRDLRLCAACAAHAGAGARSVAVADPEPARRGAGRLRLSLRHRGDAVPAAAVVPARLPHDGVPVRPDHALQRHRRHGDEDHHSDHPAQHRIPPGPHGERAHQHRAGRRPAPPSCRACRSCGWWRC